MDKQKKLFYWTISFFMQKIGRVVVGTWYQVSGAGEVALRAREVGPGASPQCTSGFYLIIMASQSIRQISPYEFQPLLGTALPGK